MNLSRARCDGVTAHRSLISVFRDSAARGSPRSFPSRKQLEPLSPIFPERDRQEIVSSRASLGGLPQAATAQPNSIYGACGCVTRLLPKASRCLAHGLPMSTNVDPHVSRLPALPYVLPLELQCGALLWLWAYHDVLGSPSHGQGTEPHHGVIRQH